MIIQADARRIPLRDGSVHCVVTSPPYWGLRDYGDVGQIGLERTYQEYVASIVAVFREVRRVLTTNGTAWLVLGDCFNTMAGKVGQRPGGGRQGDKWKEKGRMTSPNRLPQPGLKRGDLVGVPWRVAFALQEDGWWLRSDIIWAKRNHMPESVKNRPTRSHEFVFLLAQSETYYYNADAIREPHRTLRRPEGGPTPKRKAAGTRPNVKGLRRSPEPGEPNAFHPLGRNARSVWSISTQPYPLAHFATFPEEIPSRCIRAGSRWGDVVLDPFAGTGTTGRVCYRLGRRFVGLDLNLGYLQDMAMGRDSGVQMEIPS